MLRKAVLPLIGSALAILFGYLVFAGYICINYPSERRFPIRGIDISRHQGDIDWKKVSETDLDFVYIKATEGRTYQDKNFTQNWEGARSAGMVTGAYHFFTFNSDGHQQANNFISTVPVCEDTLPPVIDIEFHGNSSTIPDRQAFRVQLDAFISDITRHYGVSPILYVMDDSYEMYILGGYPEHPIWYRDILSAPHLKDKRDWLFWQYSDRGRIAGISGPVDLDVFKGSRDQFDTFCKRTPK